MEDDDEKGDDHCAQKEAEDVSVLKRSIVPGPATVLVDLLRNETELNAC